MEKQTLHYSIKAFKQPVLIFETATFRIRIDDLGNFKYRYTCWPVKNKISDKPALILKNGVSIPEGNGGNAIYEFKRDYYTYNCFIWWLVENNLAPGLLKIYKDGKEILKQNAKKIIH